MGKLKQEFENIVLPFAKSKGAERFGTVGTCWGSYMVLRMSSYDQFVAGASWHPSHSPISGLLGEDELGSRLKIVEFGEMQHGWTVRGDMGDPAIKRDVNKAIKETLDFFAAHL